MLFCVDMKLMYTSSPGINGMTFFQTLCNIKGTYPKFEIFKEKKLELTKTLRMQITI